MDYLVELESVKIRKMQDKHADYKLLACWLTNPVVLQYYEGRDNPFDYEKVIEKYSPRVMEEELVTPCIIELMNCPIGYLQFYPIEDYETRGKINFSSYKNPYGIDLFIGEPDYWNKGYGTKAIKAINQYLFNSLGADVVFIDPQTWNKRAIRCYQKCGFTPLCIIEKREWHEGEYKDNLIMALTKKQFENEPNKLILSNIWHC